MHEWIVKGTFAPLDSLALRWERFNLDLARAGAWNWRSGDRAAAAGAELKRRAPALPGACAKAEAPVAAHPAVNTASAEDLHSLSRQSMTLPLEKSPAIDVRVQARMGCAWYSKSQNNACTSELHHLRMSSVWL